MVVFDEFQEIVRIDDTLPNLMRAIFQTQREVGHVYLGSRRHVLTAIFNDRHEPFWRSTKQIELGRIDEDDLSSFVRARFEASDRGIDDEALARLLELTDGHPYATQELAYFTWEEVPLRPCGPRRGRRGSARPGPALGAQQPRPPLGGRDGRTSGSCCSPSTRSPVGSTPRRTGAATVFPRLRRYSGPSQRSPATM